jgi:hypothetical protein
LLVLAVAGMMAVCVITRFNGWLLMSLFLLAALVVTGLYMRVRQPGARLIIAGAAATAFISVFMFTFLYPALFRYQSGQQAARWLRQQRQSEMPVAQWRQFSYTLELYHKGPVARIATDSAAVRFLLSGGAVYTSKAAANELAAKIPGVSVVTVPHYPVSRLQLNFLRPARRQQQLEERALALPPKKP